MDSKLKSRILNVIHEHLKETKGLDHTGLQIEEQMNSARKVLYEAARELVAEADQAQQAAAARRPAGAGARLDVSKQPGRNGFERVLSHLRANDPAFAKLAWDRQCSLASTFRSVHRPITGDQAYDAQ